MVGRPEELTQRLPVPLDPALAEALDDAVAGQTPRAVPPDPNRVLGADPHDFAGLYIRHRSSFALHARRFLRDQRDVDEVVQEAFLRLFLALPELQSELQALAYCRRTITNLCIDRYRADQRRPRLVDLDSVPPDALPEDETEDPVIQAEDAAIVREALALLSPLHREALVKREIEEKPLPVIAAELEVPEESVKHLLHRARRALRRRLATTHLAPGVDLDDVSTLRLLARSAASGGGRLAAVLMVLLGLAVSASSTVPADRLSGLWQPPAQERVPQPAAVRPAPRAGLPPQVVRPVPQPEVGGPLPGVFGADRDFAGPLVLPPDPAGPSVPAGPAAVPLPVEGPVPATGTVDASSSPAPTLSPAATPSPAPTPSPTVVPDVVPRTVASASPSPSPAAAPSATPSPEERVRLPRLVPGADPVASLGAPEQDDRPDQAPLRLVRRGLPHTSQ